MLRDVGWKAGHTLIDDVGESEWDMCAEEGLLNMVSGGDTIGDGMVQRRIRGSDGMESGEAFAFDGGGVFAILERGQGESDSRVPEVVAGGRKTYLLSVYKVDLLNGEGDHGEG